MSNQESKKVVKSIKKVSTSTELVNFKASKDHGQLKKDQVYTVSLNIAEILEAKVLGKQV